MGRPVVEKARGPVRKIRPRGLSLQENRAIPGRISGRLAGRIPDIPCPEKRARARGGGRYCDHCSSMRGSIAMAALRSASAPAASPSASLQVWRDQ